MESESHRNGLELSKCLLNQHLQLLANRELSRTGLCTGSLSKVNTSFWVYILENATGKFYIGSTDDLQARLATHNDPDRSKAHYTAKHGPWRLVWSEQHSTRSAAVQRERALKSMKSSKWIRTHLLGQPVE